MPTLHIQVGETLVAALAQEAQRTMTTVEDVARGILKQHVQKTDVPPKTYTFIGIGHSGKRHISTQAEAILTEAVNHQEGWSTPE